jgi:hypothetical protein
MYEKDRDSYYSKKRVGLSTEYGDVRNVGTWLRIETVWEGGSEDIREVERRRPSR